MYVCLVCHTESDFVNKFGNTFKIPRKKQTYEHLKKLFPIFNKSGIKVTYNFSVGGRIGSDLLTYYKENNLEILGEIGIHIHYEKWDGVKWNSPISANLTKEEFEKNITSWNKIMKVKPLSCVFGHWWLSENYLEWLSENKILIDSSYTTTKQNLKSENFVLKPPFYKKNVLEVPVICENKKATLNPFTFKYHQHIIKKLIKENYLTDSLFCIGFHSYDLFENGKLTKNSKSFLNYLKNLNNENIEFIGLSDVKRLYDSHKISKKIIDNIKMSLFIKIEHKIRMLIKKIKSFF